MRRITVLALLLAVSAALVSSCSDGVDERASLGTAYVTMYLDSNPNFDLYKGKKNDNGTVDNETDDFCESVLNQEAGGQTVNFIVTPNPISKSPIGLIYVKQTKVELTPLIAGEPYISSFTSKQYFPLVGGVEDEAGGESSSYITSAFTFPLFNDKQLQEFIDYFAMVGSTSARYEVKYKFTLFEVDTGIEEELESGSSVIQILDVKDLPEDQECSDY
ncbi:MAG: hypothetical protein LBD73_07910 [Deferribacteraceae bacterium]|jgi:hypothetical protein|nr:hypothetical protein [Deferribacteraceae bacterium]